MAMEYFYELFADLPRQGPGCRKATLRALGLLKDLPAERALQTPMIPRLREME